MNFLFQNQIVIDLITLINLKVRLFFKMNVDDESHYVDIGGSKNDLLVDNRTENSKYQKSPSMPVNTSRSLLDNE